MKIEYEGVVHEFPDDFTDADIQSALSSAPESTPKKQSSLLETLYAGPAEAALQLGTGAIATPLAGLAGLATGGNAQTVENVQNALTYQPRTQAGQGVSGLIAKPFQWLAEKADTVGQKASDATGSPAIGAGVNTSMQMIPAILATKGVNAVRGNALAREADNAVLNATVRDASQNGYVIPPSQMAQTGLGKAAANAVERIAGPEALERSASARNAPRVNEAVRADANIPGRGQISEADLDAARQPHFAVYDDVRRVSPTANDLVDMWRAALFERNRQNTFYNRSANPAAQDAANAAGQRANLLEQMIDREVAAHGRPQLGAQLAEARISLGRLGTVERSLNEASGNASAQSLKQARDRGVPVQNSPNMNMAANVSEAFRNRLTQQPPVRGEGQGAASIIAAVLGGPKALAWTGLPAAMRAALLSRPVQAMARPGVPEPLLSTQEQLRRAALVSALQQQGE